jgi:hypothetical protein
MIHSTCAPVFWAASRTHRIIRSVLPPILGEPIMPTTVTATETPLPHNLTVWSLHTPRSDPPPILDARRASGDTAKPRPGLSLQYQSVAMHSPPGHRSPAESQPLPPPATIQSEVTFATVVQIPAGEGLGNAPGSSPPNLVARQLPLGPTSGRLLWSCPASVDGQPLQTAANSSWVRDSLCPPRLRLLPETPPGA